MPHLARMPVDRTDGPAILHVPPDEPAVVAAGDGRIADEANARGVTAMIGVFDLLDSLLSEIVDLVLGTAYEQALAVRGPRHGQEDVAALDFTGDAEIARIGGHDVLAAYGYRHVAEFARIRVGEP